MKKIKTFQKVINFVMQHGDRLVLDDYIYLNVEKDGSSLLQLVYRLNLSTWPSRLQSDEHMAL
jgi:hypothetical protein